MAVIGEILGEIDFVTTRWFCCGQSTHQGYVVTPGHVFSTSIPTECFRYLAMMNQVWVTFFVGTLVLWHCVPISSTVTLAP